MEKQKSANKIIILIAPPRSLSTAFLRMIAERNDFNIINEPACSIYNRLYYPYTDMYYSPQAFTSYSEVSNKIFFLAEQTNVFVKEMSYAFEDFVVSYPAILTKPNVYFIFLLRNPHHCLISFYKKFPSPVLDYIITDFENLTGYHSLSSLYKTVKTTATHPPYIIDAQQLYTNTEETLQAFCRHVHIPYAKKYLHWRSLGKKFNGFNEWQESKKQEFTQHWHHEAICSNTFHKPTSYDVDKKNRPTFSEIKNDGHRKICLEIYKKNYAIYNLLKQR